MTGATIQAAVSSITNLMKVCYAKNTQDKNWQIELSRLQRNWDRTKIAIQGKFAALFNLLQRYTFTKNAWKIQIIDIISFCSSSPKYREEDIT